MYRIEDDEKCIRKRENNYRRISHTKQQSVKLQSARSSIETIPLLPFTLFSEGFFFPNVENIVALAYGI